MVPGTIGTKRKRCKPLPKMKIEVIFGMPKEAIKLGAQHVLPLNQMAQFVINPNTKTAHHSFCFSQT